MNRQNIYRTALLALPALAFILSGITKLFPIYSFELQLVSQGICSWETAPYLSRFIIVAELWLGVGFLSGSLLKRVYIPVSLGMLLVFTAHLIWGMFTQGNAGNCGCFGELIPMTPLEAVLKNIFLIAVIIFIRFRVTEITLSPWLHFSLFFAVFFLIVILFPIKPYLIQDTGTSPAPAGTELKAAEEPAPAESLQKEKEELSKVVQKDSVAPAKPVTASDPLPQRKSAFAKYTNFFGTLPVNLDKGKNIVAVFSLDCDHCMNAAKDMQSLKKKYPELPGIYCLFLGDEIQIDPFFEYAGGEFPWIILPPEEFFPLLVNSPPRVIVLHNGNIIKDMDSKTDIKTELERYVKALN